MTRILQIALVIAGSIPLALGIMNFVLATNAPWVGEVIATPSLDNQLRFYAIWFTLPFPLSIWMARNLDRALPIATILFTTMFLGGLARAFSISQVGLPNPPLIGAMVTEIVFILFIPWVAFVSRRLNRNASDNQL